MKSTIDIILNRFPEPVNITFSLPGPKDKPPKDDHIAYLLAMHLLENGFMVTHEPQLDIIHNFYEHRFTIFVYKPEKKA